MAGDVLGDDAPDATLLRCGDLEWTGPTGELHRDDGPSLITADGTYEWYLHGVRHRVGGPAVIRANGQREWYLHGVRHRTDGPAVTRPSGADEFWVDGYATTARGLPIAVSLWLRTRAVDEPGVPRLARAS